MKHFQITVNVKRRENLMYKIYLGGGLSIGYGFEVGKIFIDDFILGP